MLSLSLDITRHWQSLRFLSIYLPQLRNGPDLLNFDLLRQRTLDQNRDLALQTGTNPLVVQVIHYVIEYSSSGQI